MRLKCLFSHELYSEIIVKVLIFLGDLQEFYVYVYIYYSKTEKEDIFIYVINNCLFFFYIR